MKLNAWNVVVPNLELMAHLGWIWDSFGGMAFIFRDIDFFGRKPHRSIYKPGVKGTASVISGFFGNQETDS